MGKRNPYQQNWLQRGRHLGVVALGCALALSASSAFAARHYYTAPDRVPGELIVKFRDKATARASQALVLHALEGHLGRGSVLNVRPVITDPSLTVYRLNDDPSVSAAQSILGNETAVEYAEPNYRFYALDDGIPNDPDFAKSWSLHNLGQGDKDGNVGTPGADIDVLPLWQLGFHGSRNVLVAVIDTGIDWAHPDLQANLYTNPGEAGPLSNNGKDDDGNGFIDDVHGWNFIANNNNSMDDNGHGSHCAGVIGAQGDNKIGTAGINWEVSLMPVKFLDDQGGGTLEGAVNAINYARMMKVNIMSNSWGGGQFAQTLMDAVTAAKNAGILFVAAAGNDGMNNDGTPAYPASFDVDNVVSVAATDNRDRLAEFSNYGKKMVHVAAPGVNVYSTYMNKGWETLSGTSMATPHVAGIAALLLSVDPHFTYQDLKNRLIETSDPMQSLRKKVAARGRVDAYNAMFGIVPPNPDPAENLWKTENYDVESAHPYKDKENWKIPVTAPGAKYIRVHFSKVEVENRYDKVLIETPDGQLIDEITGSVSDYTSDYVIGDSLVIHFTSDDSNEGWGFQVDRAQWIGDVPGPVPPPVPSPSPSMSPSPVPSVSPSAGPSPEPSTSPSVGPSPEPSPNPSVEPSASPSV